MKPSKTKIKNFRKKIFDIANQELELRAQLKRMYDQFILDAEDDPNAIRIVRQAYFEGQKYRVAKLLEERMEFHPFFTSNPFKSLDEMMGGEEGDDIV